MSVPTTRRTFVQGLSGGAVAAHLNFAPNQTCKAVTCELEKADSNKGLESAK
jgi:hypothetical protein